MSSETLATQSSTLSIRQRLSISEESKEEALEGVAGFTNEQLINAINNSNASLDISSIILQVLGQFNSASLGNTDVSGTITISGDAIVENVDSQTINTGVLSVGDELIIGESSTFSLITKINDFETTITTFNSRIENMEGNKNILQITGTSLTQGLSDEIIESTTYQIINDLSLTLVALKENSQYKILLNFNYLSSNYYDTLLNVAMCYKINNGSEIIIGEYLLGNENTSFKYDFFSNNFYENITSSIGNNLNFYIKAKIHSENTTSFYNSIDNIYKPKILLSLSGNILNIEEVNN